MQQVLSAPSELVADILKTFKKNHGVDLQPVLEDASLSRRQKTHQMRLLLRDGIARQFGLQHNDPAFILLAKDDGTKVAPVPNLLYEVDKINHLQSISGNEIFKFVSLTSNALQLMDGADHDEALASLFIGSGILAIAGPMAVKVISELRKAVTITREVLKAAIRTGVRSVGVASVVFTVAILLAEILLYLAFEVTKEFFGLVFNMTPYDLMVKDWDKGGDDIDYDLYMKHGKVVSFMDNYPFGEMEDINLLACVNDEAGNFTAAYAGFYFCEKNGGMFGAEGMAIFHSQEQEASQLFALSFACPYREDNGTNVSIVDNISDRKAFYNGLYSNRSLDASITNDNFQMAARANSESGGEAAGIAFIMGN